MTFARSDLAPVLDQGARRQGAALRAFLEVDEGLDLHQKGVGAGGNRRMLIPDEHIDDFIKRWEIAFGERLSREDARAKAIELIEFYKLIGRRRPIEEPQAPA